MNPAVPLIIVQIFGSDVLADKQRQESAITQLQKQIDD